MTGSASAAAARPAVAVVAALRSRGQSVATAESLTGGLVGAAITSVAGASEVYRGGLIAYATELKHQLAGVSELTLAADGPVAASTAAELAQGAARICGADWGLATTGVAGPDGQAGHPVGQVFVAVAGPGGGAGAGGVGGPVAGVGGPAAGGAAGLGGAAAGGGAGLGGAAAGGAVAAGLVDARPSCARPGGWSVGDDAGSRRHHDELRVTAAGEASGVVQVWVRELALAGDRDRIRQLTVSAVLGWFAELLDPTNRSRA